MKTKFGTVEKHGNKYRATAMINGERLRNSFNSEPEADSWIESLRTQLILHDADSVSKAEKLTIAELFKQFSQDPNYPRPREQSSKFNSLLDTLEKLGLAEIPIGRFKTRHVLAIRDARHQGGVTPRGKKLNPQTINKDLTFISGAYVYATLVLEVETVAAKLSITLIALPNVMKRSCG